MAVVCAQVPLTIGTYTAISSAGQTNVSFILNIGTCRMVIATSQPADSSTAFVHVSAEGGWQPLTSLGTSDIVYLRPGRDGIIAEVVKG